MLDNMVFPAKFSTGLLLQGRLNMGLCGKGLTHSHTMTPFDTPGKQAF